MRSGFCDGSVPESGTDLPQKWARSAGTVDAVFPAARGGTATPLGSTYVASTDMFVQVVDGIAGAWSTTAESSRIDARQLAARVLATMRETGLVEV